MLRTSTKNVAQEVVSALVYSRKGGVLSDLLREIQKNTLSKASKGIEKTPRDEETSSKHYRSGRLDELEGAEDEEGTLKETIGEQIPSLPKKSQLNNRRASKKLIFKAGETEGSGGSFARKVQ